MEMFAIKIGFIILRFLWSGQAASKTLFNIAHHIAIQVCFTKFMDLKTGVKANCPKPENTT